MPASDIHPSGSMTKRFINSFEVTELVEKDEEHWVTLRDMRGHRINLRVPQFTASELHVGGIVDIYFEV